MKIKVLIVDDTTTTRMHERLLLVDLGFEIDEARDGIEAMKKVSVDRPDLVLMDIEMPKMDGIECCRMIKQDKRFRETKVIMVSSKDEFSKIDEAFKAGCDDYVTKPIDRAELLEKIGEISELVCIIQQLRR